MGIKFATSVRMQQLRELLSGKQVDTPQEALSVFDIVLKEVAAQRYIFQHYFAVVVALFQNYELPPFEPLLILIMLLSYISIGRNFYSPDLRKPHQLGGGIESWRGFYQSIRPTQMGLSLNIG